MKTKFHPYVLLLLVLLGLASCETNKEGKSKMLDNSIMEVTTFSIDSAADPNKFAQLDKAVENDFTSQQPGFIKRQSGIDDKGDYVVVVFWESVKDAEASMAKFMGDASVADYAQMIDGPTMKMARYTMDHPFEAKASQFVEIMSYSLNEGTDPEKFKAVNHRVETEFTGKRPGFLQRLTGADESGAQVVAVYWASKETSDAALQPFMEAPIAGEFMQYMDQTTMVMGRYEFLDN
ncbi:MAG: hypothetical protein AAF927_00220 [Bacteroidota bacterium]